MVPLTPEVATLVALVRPFVHPSVRADLTQALRQVEDADALVALAVAHRVLPLVARTAGASAREHRPALLERLRPPAREAAAEALIKVGHLRALSSAFARVDIPVLAWKGPALSLRAWGDATLRTYDDLDLVVRPEDRVRARDFVRRLGWAPRFPMSDAQEDVIFAGQCAYESTWPTDGTLLELHWAFGARRYSGFPRVAGVLARAEPLAIGDAMIHVPAPADALLLHAVHATKHGWSTLEDVALFARLRRDVDEGSVRALAEAEGGRRAFALACRLADLVFADAGAGIVASADGTSAEARAIDALVDQVFARWAAGTTAWRSSMAWDLAWTDGVARRARLLSRSIFDPTLQEWGAVRLPARLGACYRILRPARLAWRRLTR